MSLKRPQQLKAVGDINYNGRKWTYYDEKVIPGQQLNIPGRHTDDNLVKDGNGYICLASRDLDKGTLLLTPILNPNGAQYTGVVYDVSQNSGTVEVYVNF